MLKIAFKPDNTSVPNSDSIFPKILSFSTFPLIASSKILSISIFSKNSPLYFSASLKNVLIPNSSFCSSITSSFSCAKTLSIGNIIKMIRMTMINTPILLIFFICNTFFSLWQYF